MRAHPYMFLLCYLRNYLQNRSPRKYSGDASDTLRRCATLCILFGSRSLGEDKLAHFARILLLLTLTLTGGCFQIHSILKTEPTLALSFFLLFSSVDFSFEHSIQVRHEILLFKQWGFTLREDLILKFPMLYESMLLMIDIKLYGRPLELTHLAQLKFYTHGTAT